MFYSQRIHDKCYRRPHFDAGQFVEKWDDERRAQGLLPLQDGLQGPDHLQRLLDHALERRRVLPDPAPGHGCIGCSEDGFWDKGSFYDRLTDIHAVRHRGERRQGRRASPPASSARRSSAHAAVTRDQARRRSKTRPDEGRGDNDHGRHRNPRLQARQQRQAHRRRPGHAASRATCASRSTSTTKNVIRNAVSTGTMWRGLEVILKGRDPRDAWAFAERICGVCTGVHALASVRAVEDALQHQDPGQREHHPQPDARDAVRAGPPGALLPPARARLGRRGHARSRPIRRSTSELAQSISQLAEVVAGLLPRPAEPAEEVRRVRPARAVPQRLLGPPGLQAAARGQPDGGGALPRGARLPEGDRQDPDHLRRQEPAPELAGRRRAVLDQPRRRRRGRRDQHGAAEHGRARSSTTPSTFIDNVYIPDLLAIASFYKDWGAIGGGSRARTCSSYGEFPDIANDDSNKSLLMPRGAIINGNLKEILAVDLKDPTQIQEFVDPLLVQVRRRDQGPAPLRRRDRARTSCSARAPRARKTDIEELDESAKYSWVKAPRWQGPADGSRPARALRHRLREGQAGVQGAGRHGAEEARRAAAGALLDARPHRGARPRVLVGGAQDEVLLRQADGQHQGRQTRHRQRRQVGARRPGRRRPRASATARRRAARSGTGSRSRTPRSTTTSASCRPPGTPARATRRTRSAPTRPR